MTSAQLDEPRDIAHSGVLVVGGTSGVGLAAARAFSAAGAARLVLVGRNRERGEAACEQLRNNCESRVNFVAADIGAVEGALSAAQQARQHLDRIDVLINTAASPHLPKLLHDCEIQQIGGVVTDLLMPTFLMTRAVLPWMRAQASGCIINVASDAAKTPTPGESVIGAAMAAIVMFTRTLATEAKRDGIRVNVLTPSLIHDTGTAERLFADDFSARLFGKARKLAHLGVSTPDDQAALMLYLAGPHGHRLTGQAISVNGGISSA